MSVLLAGQNITGQGGVLMIDAGETIRGAEAWPAIGTYFKGYWQTLLNLTNHIAAQQP
jgi:hypothetical protein